MLSTAVCVDTHSRSTQCGQISGKLFGYASLIRSSIFLSKDSLMSALMFVRISSAWCRPNSMRFRRARQQWRGQALSSESTVRRSDASLALGHIVLRHRPKAGQICSARLPDCPWPHACARRHQLSTVGHFRRGDGLELLEIFQRLAILLCPVQCGSEQKGRCRQGGPALDWCPEIFAGLSWLLRLPRIHATASLD